MQISLMVCDDLEEERYALVRMLQEYGTRKGLELKLESAAGGEELLSLWRPGRWNIVFLDIFMPGLSGVETAQALRERDRDCCLVFATTSEDHGVVGYKLRVMDYLLKPFSQRELDGVMDWYLEEHAERLRTLRLWVDWNETEVLLGDILYIEVRSHVASVHTAGGVICTNRGLDSLEQEIAEARFLRCHRSYLVNLEHVRGLREQELLLDNGDRVPVSKKQLPKIKHDVMEWAMLRSWET